MILKGGAIFTITEQQKAIIAEIENATCAQIMLGYNDIGFYRWEGQLCSKEIVYDEDGDEINAPIQFSYLLDIPLESVMPEAQIELYPASVRQELRALAQADEPEFGESCNILTSWSYGNDLDEVLIYMREYTKLLDIGWHLGNEDEFLDPFIRYKKPRTEADEIWDEYDSEKIGLELGATEEFSC